MCRGYPNDIGCICQVVSKSVRCDFAIISEFFCKIFYGWLCDETDAKDAATTLPQPMGCGGDVNRMDNRRDLDGFRDENPIFNNAYR